MSKPWILISPSNRGIGRALTRHLLRTTSLPIVVTTRSSSLEETKDSLLDGLYMGNNGANSTGTDSGKRDDQTSLDDEQQQQQQRSRLHVLQLDVTDEASVQDAARRAAQLFPRTSHHLHLGFALPGVLRPERSPGQIDYAGALETLRVNTLGPMMLVKHFGAEFLPRAGTRLATTGGEDAALGGGGVAVAAAGGGGGGGGERGRWSASGAASYPAHWRPLRLPYHATWVTMSARVGSITDNRLGGWYSYRCSKAAVNSLTKTFDIHLQQRQKRKLQQHHQQRGEGWGDGRGTGGIIPAVLAIAYHPGTVRTEFSREFWAGVPEGKLFSPEYAAELMAEVVCSRTEADRGRIWDWNGDEIMP
ncbi:hypothetical protein BX600DRAFT_498819 [Xylariales sp. PMI_506]|nr:hypothetical protein BX600DRAFT_498819 [Xylariales sp. PMI_506]